MMEFSNENLHAIFGQNLGIYPLIVVECSTVNINIQQYNGQFNQGRICKRAKHNGFLWGAGGGGGGS